MVSASPPHSGSRVRGFRRFSIYFDKAKADC